MYKKISIIIFSNYKNNNLQILKNNKIIVNKIINNEYTFNGLLNCGYGIRIISNDIFYSGSIYIDDNGTYIFDIRKKIFHKIFIKLVDKNYKNLLIEKGEINLWQNHTL